MADRTGDEQLFGGYSGRLLVILTAGFFVITMGRRLLPPLLPEIVSALGITTFAAGIVLTVFRVVRAITQYPGGRYSDALSRKTVIVGSMALIVVGFGLLSVAGDYAMLLVGVAVVGAASGLFVPANRALLSDLFAEKRARAFGLNMGASDVTGIVAAGLAIAVVEYATWQTAFLAVVVPVVVVLGVFAWTSREPLQIEKSSLAIRETVGRLIGRRQIRLVVAAYSLRGFATSGVSNFLPLFLIVVHGFSFELASGAYALRFVVGIVAKPCSGVLGDRFSRPGIAIFSLLTTAAGVGLIVVAPTGAVVIGGVVIYAVGQKSFGAPMQAYLMDSFPDDTMGGDLGATRTTYKGIGSLGPAAVGFLADAVNFPAAYTAVVLVILLAAGIVLWIERSAPGAAGDDG